MKNNWQTGDLVVCTRSSESTYLDKGVVYELVNQNEHGNWMVKKQFNGPCSAHWYKPERFVPFDTQPSVISLDKVYKTKLGNEVKLFAFSDDVVYPIVGQITTEEVVFNATWTKDGKYTQAHEHDFDLVEVKELEPLEIEFNGLTCLNKQSFVKVYLDGSMYISCAGNGSMSSKQVGEIAAFWDHLQTLK